MSDETLQRRKQLLRQRMREQRLLAADSEPTITRRPDEPTPLSPGQQRMWFLQNRYPDDTTLNVCVAYRLDGELDPARLHSALDTIVVRHEVLRSGYRVGADGLPVQVPRTGVGVLWQEHDLSQRSAEGRERGVEVLARREFARPFDLEHDLPLRVTLVRLDAAAYVLILVAHHIAWDDDSWSVFFTELNAAYRGGELPALRAQYADVATVGRPTDEADAAFWREQLKPLPDRIELPGPPGARESSRVADKVLRPLDAQLVEGVAALGRELGATPFTVLLAAFEAVLSRYTAASDFLVAVPVTDRRGSHAPSLIGYFGNTVLIRARTEPTWTFADLVTATRDTCTAAFAHQGLGVEQVVREVSAGRASGGDGLAQLVQLSFGTRGSANGFDLPGVRARELDLSSQVAQEPLGMMVVLDEDRPRLELTYQVDQLGRELVTQLLDHYLEFVGEALRDPRRALHAMDMLGAEGRAGILEISHGPIVDIEPTTLVDLLERQAATTPDDIAVIGDHEELTYRALHARANRLAHWLIGRGIGPEDLVALRIATSVEFIVAALAVMKSGAAYLPIDPGYPADRIEYLLSDARPRLVLAAEDIAVAEEAAAALVETNPTDTQRIAPLYPSNIAYVIYTSGSTGKPKGVPVPHEAIADHMVNFAAEWMAITDTGDRVAHRVLQTTSVSFDASLGDTFLPLVGGACVVVPKPNAYRDIPYIADLITRHEITILHMVPSILATFLRLPEAADWRALRHVPVGGEALPGEVADRFATQFDAELRNHYGPTEAVVCSTSMPVEGPQGTRIVPIGYPNRNVYLYLLDDALRLVPPGVVGEIYIGGRQLARGYLDRPGATAERFVADPFLPGERLYRTGDIARRTADGEIEFIGRADEQVKVRGFRIELGEVEAAIADHPGVAGCVAVVTEHETLGPVLAAYLVPRDDVTLDLQQVRAFVARVLPEHMVPAAFAVIDEIPLSAHGKLDRRALPAPVVTTTHGYREPETPTEIRVARIYQELFDAERVGADDSFFELGGHSLLAARLVTMIRATFGMDIDVRVPFETPTVAGLAAHLVAVYAEQVGGNLDEAVPDELAGAAMTSLPTKRERPERLPLSYAQRALWLRRKLEGAFAWENFRLALRFDGPLDIAALNAAVGDVLDRHSALRTVFPEESGVAYQQILPSETVELPRTVLRADGSRSPQQLLTEALEAEAAHVFDLATGPLYRLRLFELDEHTHVLSVLMHHLVTDRESCRVFVEDLSVAYRARLRGARPTWPELPLEFADFAIWQRETFDHVPGREQLGEYGQRQLDYWCAALDGLPVEIAVAHDRPRPAHLGYAGTTASRTLPATTWRALRALAESSGATEFMLCQAAAAVLVHTLGGGDDVPIGATVANRPGGDTRNLVGLFADMAVLRTDLSGAPTVREVLGRVRESALGTLVHQDVPFERIVETLNPPRVLGRNPLFQILMQFGQQTQVSSFGDGDVTVTVEAPQFDVAFMDFHLDFLETATGELTVRVITNSQLYDPSTGEVFADVLAAILHAFAEHPDRSITTLGAAPADWDSARTVVRRTEDTGTSPEVEDGPPRTETEKALVALLEELLEITDVGRTDGFFALGGDSVMAIQWAARAGERGLALTPQMVFEHLTIAELAAAVDTAGSAPSTEPAVDEHRHAPMSTSGLSEDALAMLRRSWAAQR
ncbi:non-ribosomal peptide synthetase [Nocardia paucivorans]|uniref:non-ribosomal peptide synthetase n=1 Tax=Nocardia paucivorans TaxID=114259 RepID=UPI00030A5664|nr:non-ribosomal peptide synthetase [Nocardia paucivorans]